MKTVVGLTFPSKDSWGYAVNPSILTVLPKGSNVKYCSNNSNLNDDEVEYYLCAVYITGVKEFKEWASKHDKNKIIVGGYQPTIAPYEFTDYAHKIVLGACDNIYKTILQEGQLVKGITSYKKFPRYDLHNLSDNNIIFPDKFPNEILTTLNTSYGCTMKCEFCCTSYMANKLCSKPLDYLEQEINYHINLKGIVDVCFINDENCLLQNDWYDRLKIISKAAKKTMMFASANVLDKDRIKKLKECNVRMVFLGLDDVKNELPKNKNLIQICNELHDNDILTMVSTIIDPLTIIKEEDEQDYLNLSKKRFMECKASAIYSNFLLPFPGTPIYDKYKHLINGEEDYHLYVSTNPKLLIKDLSIANRMETNMYNMQIDYYESDWYNNNVRNFHNGDVLDLAYSKNRFN